MKKTLEFKASGYVLGNYWGGGSGCYNTITIKADTLEELVSKCNKALEDGSLDNGMGFESLIGAIMNVTTITTIDFEDKEYTNQENQLHFFGKLTEEQEEFLNEIYY
jgi:hypothetical protein